MEDGVSDGARDRGERKGEEKKSRRRPWAAGGGCCHDLDREGIRSRGVVSDMLRYSW